VVLHNEPPRPDTEAERELELEAAELDVSYL
jgi:hypothetical protein